MLSRNRAAEATWERCFLCVEMSRNTDPGAILSAALKGRREGGGKKPAILTNETFFPEGGESVELSLQQFAKDNYSETKCIHTRGKNRAILQGKASLRTRLSRGGGAEG